MSEVLSVGSVWRLRCGIAADTAVLWLARGRGSFVADQLRAVLAEKYRLLALHHRCTGHTERAIQLEAKTQYYASSTEDEDDASLIGVLNGAGPKRPHPSLRAAIPLPDPPLSVDAIGRHATSDRKRR